MVLFCWLSHRYEFASDAKLGNVCASSRVAVPWLGASKHRRAVRAREGCCCHNHSSDQDSKTCCLQHFAYSAFVLVSQQTLQALIEVHAFDLFIDYTPDSVGICFNKGM